MENRYQKLIKSYHPIINALQDHVDRLEVLRTANRLSIRQADAIAIDIPQKPSKSTVQSIRKMIVKLGGFRPENYEKITAYLDNKVASLENHIKMLENIVVGGSPRPEINLNQGPLTMIDFIEKDQRRRIFLALHERSDGSIVHATNSQALGTSLADPDEIIGHDLHDLFDHDSYELAIHRIRMASKYGIHRSVNCFRRNLMDHETEMRVYVPPGEKHLIVNIIQVIDQRMSNCHLTQPVERYDFSAAHEFYARPQPNVPGTLFREVHCKP